jgi:response regulator RpfG family c-di-GMP phosphodiesterase
MNETLTLLYVDDEPINLRLFILNFKKRYTVITAESGFEGLDKLKAHPETSVVISDMKMPRMNGLDFIRKAKVAYPHISFFILTGFDISDEISNALHEGLIHKYFRKPFNMREIESAIQEALYGR